ncbi:MAG: hypothetical protein ACR2H9_02975 [Longimicrobiaceae bacterium]
MSAAEREREYAVHAARKEERVRQLLDERELAHLFRGMERCPIACGYRAHAVIRVEHTGAEAQLLGVDPLRGKVPLAESLWVLPEAAREQVRCIAGVLERTDSLPLITAFELLLEHGSERTHLSLAVPRSVGATLEPLCRQILDETPELLGIAVPSQRLDLGEPYLRHRLRGTTVLAHHRAFFQSNLRLVPRLVEEIQSGFDAPGSIVDLYCGVGLHSILAATPAAGIAGADTNRWAIESAWRNAKLHGLAGARYHRLSAQEFAVEHRFRSPAVVVFVNPSRGGCEPGVPEAVARWQPERICLISCSLDSHLRDLRSFLRKGYRPLGVRSFDMFPFSPFVESVSFLEPT